MRLRIQALIPLRTTHIRALSSRAISPGCVRVLVDIATGAQLQLTYDRKALSSPKWSPSGDRVAFLADGGDEKEEKAQVFVLSMNGGDARKLTDSPTPVEQFAWRPDEKDIAYAAADESANKSEIEKHLDAFEVGDNDFLQTKAPTPWQVWRVPRTDQMAPQKLNATSWFSFTATACPLSVKRLASQIFR